MLINKLPFSGSCIVFPLLLRSLKGGKEPCCFYLTEELGAQRESLNLEGTESNFEQNVIQSVFFVLVSKSQLLGSTTVPGGEPTNVAGIQDDSHAVVLRRPLGCDLPPGACGTRRPGPLLTGAGARAVLEARGCRRQEWFSVL